jgi:hypothetical protein
MIKKKKYSSLRSKYHITIEEIAQMFEFSSANSLSASSAKNRYINGVERLIELLERRIIDR